MLECMSQALTISAINVEEFSLTSENDTGGIVCLSLLESCDLCILKIKDSAYRHMYTIAAVCVLMSNLDRQPN